MHLKTGIVIIQLTSTGLLYYCCNNLYGATFICIFQGWSYGNVSIIENYWLIFNVCTEFHIFNMSNLLDLLFSHAVLVQLAALPAMFSNKTGGMPLVPRLNIASLDHRGCREPVDPVEAAQNRLMQMLTNHSCSYLGQPLTLVSIYIYIFFHEMKSFLTNDFRIKNDQNGSLH